jgi:hypothetical protein
MDDYRPETYGDRIADLYDAVTAAMVERLRAKPGGEAIPVILGDFADLPVEGGYRLVYAVFNTFFSLLTQDDQVRCFRAVADRLTPDGAFALELFVPDPTPHPGGQSIRTRHLGSTWPASTSPSTTRWASGSTSRTCC